MSGRAWARLVAALLWMIISLSGWAICWPFGRGPGWVKRFLGGIGWLLGLRVTIVGHPVPGPALYVANHLTFLDILALGGAVPMRFVAKGEIAGWGLVGFLAKVGGSLFVSRERRSETRGQADLLVTALRSARRPVLLFGEGATGDGVVLKPFRPALFAAAVEAGVPVQPVAVDYGPGRAGYAWPDDVDFGDEAKKMMNRRGRVPVTLRFLAPLDAHTLDRKALAAQSRAAIEAALE